MSNTDSPAHAHEGFSWDHAELILADASLRPGPAHTAAIHAQIRQDAANAAIHLMSLARVAHSASR